MYVRPTDGVVIEAVAPLWGPAYVLVSTDLLDWVKDPGERRALLAHEQAHLDYGDAKLGLVLPVVGALTLTGRNVLFDLYNVREREHRADLTAARSDIGTPADVVVVLKRLDDLDDRIEASQATAGAFGAAAAPFRPIGSDAGPLPALVARAFALFFGTFALTETGDYTNVGGPVKLGNEEDIHRVTIAAAFARDADETKLTKQAMPPEAQVHVGEERHLVARERFLPENASDDPVVCYLLTQTQLETRLAHDGVSKRRQRDTKWLLAGLGSGTPGHCRTRLL